jgi:uncharacterized protein YndB with AHSA1/START domain
MNKDLQVSKNISIKANSASVWDAMTNPTIIKQYLYGTQTTSDWKVGSPILFEGEFNGQKYKDKGNVLECRKNELLKYNYWSGFSGLEDKPENYCLVSYIITENAPNEVTLTWKQQGFTSEEGKCHTENGLGAMLQQIKELVEKN